VTAAGATMSAPREGFRELGDTRIDQVHAVQAWFLSCPGVQP
jgi:hypothetical protein